MDHKDLWELFNMKLAKNCGLSCQNIENQSYQKLKSEVCNSI